MIRILASPIGPAEHRGPLYIGWTCRSDYPSTRTPSLIIRLLFPHYWRYTVPVLPDTALREVCYHNLARGMKDGRSTTFNAYSLAAAALLVLLLCAQQTTASRPIQDKLVDIARIGESIVDKVSCRLQMVKEEPEKLVADCKDVSVPPEQSPSKLLGSNELNYRWSMLKTYGLLRLLQNDWQATFYNNCAHLSREYTWNSASALQHMCYTMSILSDFNLFYWE